MSETTPETERGSAAEALQDVVVLDAARLRALGHPLRVRMLGLLRLHGPSTATRLGAMLGESSGSTSYHLRQLAAHGLVVEDEAHAGEGGRERWWRAAHPSTRFESADFGDEDDRAAGVDYLRALAAAYAHRVDAWLALSPDAPAAWRDAGTLS